MNKEIKQAEPWALSEQKKKKLDKLLTEIDNTIQEGTVKLSLLWLDIRIMFPSDKLFGQYIEELRNNPAYDNIVGRVAQQDINNYCHQGRFIRKHNLKSVSHMHLSTLRELSRPANKDIADKVYSAVKLAPNIAHKDVMRIIQAEKEKSSIVLTIEKNPEHIADTRNMIQPLVRRTVDVVSGIAQEYRQTDIETIIEPPAQEIDPIYEELDRDDEETQEARPTVPFYRRHELLTALSMMDASHLTEEQRVDEILLLSKSYRMAPNRLIPTFTMCAKNCLPNYHKRPPAR